MTVQGTAKKLLGTSYRKLGRMMIAGASIILYATVTTAGFHPHWYMAMPLMGAVNLCSSRLLTGYWFRIQHNLADFR